MKHAWHGVAPKQTWRRKRDGRAVLVVRVTPEIIGAFAELQDVETGAVRWVRVSGLLERYERAEVEAA